jgi:hypothetical protein
MQLQSASFVALLSRCVSTLDVIFPLAVGYGKDEDNSAPADEVGF